MITLKTFFISQGEDFISSLVNMWHVLDNDFKGFPYVSEEVKKELTDKGYKSLADFEVQRIFKDVKATQEVFIGLLTIDRVLQAIEEGHGSFSSNFTTDIGGALEGWNVAVAYNVD